MKILHGIDLVDCAQIERLVQRHQERFLQRVFTPAERDKGKGKRAVEHLAGRFAAKEAVLKLIGTGWRGTIAWTDVEVVNGPLGEPEVILHGQVARLAEQLGIKEIRLSITHTANLAIASAVALADSDEGK